MSVLIRGMEMPTSCHKCPLLYVTSICDGSKDCPLLPVPPHGRLIDADEFLKNAQLQRCFRWDYALLLNDVIEECATIIPAEEDET